VYIVAVKYNEKPIDKWTVNDMLAYISDRHAEVYGVEYRPYRSWQAERGLIGSLIGTKGRNPKPRKYEPELVKAFVDECFRTHKATREYPGVSFTWLWTYKTSIWQRVQAEARRAKLATIENEMDYEDLAEWL
jgi:hypothetical protein